MHLLSRILRRWTRQARRSRPRAGYVPALEAVEERVCPALFSVVGATGSPTNILSIKVFDESSNLVAQATPFDNLTSIRVATGDFNGDGITDGVAAMGRRTNSDLRAEIVIYNMETETGLLNETARGFAFAPGILGNGYIATGDFNGDGFDDIVAAQIGGGRSTVTVQTLINDGAGNFDLEGSTQVDFGTISAPRIAAGDTDGDGLDEIVIAARTGAGADVRVFDADSGTPQFQGNFVWDFGIVGYARGAFVAVGEFDPTQRGEEIVLGSNVGGGGRVDVVNFDGANAVRTTNGRFTPFGANYNAAVRVAAGTINDLEAGGPEVGVDVILSGQDRFQDGLAVYSVPGFDTTQQQQDPTPAYLIGNPFQALSNADGLAPLSGTGDRTLGPFVAMAHTTIVRARGGLVGVVNNNLATPTGTGNVIAGASTANFVIDASRLGLPAGANFANQNNALFLNLNFLAPAPTVLTNAFLDLYYYTNATSPDRFVRVSGGGIDANALQLTVQIADNVTHPIFAGMDVNNQLFGFFRGDQALDGFFDGNDPDPRLGTGFWVLRVTNNLNQDLTLVDWSLIWDFA